MFFWLSFVCCLSVSRLLAKWWMNVGIYQHRTKKRRNLFHSRDVWLIFSKNKTKNINNEWNYLFFMFLFVWLRVCRIFQFPSTRFFRHTIYRSSSSSYFSFFSGVWISTLNIYIDDKALSNRWKEEEKTWRVPCRL